jgi:hypothetical protein
MPAEAIGLYVSADSSKEVKVGLFLQECLAMIHRSEAGENSQAYQPQDVFRILEV